MLSLAKAKEHVASPKNCVPRNVTRAYIRQTIGGCADRSTYTQQPAVSTMDPDYSYYDSLAEDMHLPLRHSVGE
jgi:hypothetical protein